MATVTTINHPRHKGNAIASGAARSKTVSILSRRVSGYLECASWIRRMFETGTQLKQQFGEDKVCDFSLGNPDLPPPAAVTVGLRQLADKAQEPFAFGYMSNGGYPWARQKLAEHLSLEQGTSITADEVILTCGAAGGINAFFRSVLDEDEEVLALAPYFVEYGFYAENHSGTFRAIPTHKGTFAPDLTALEAGITAKTRVLIVNSPNNPTGVIYSEDQMRGIVEVLTRCSQKFGKPIWLMADEPYRFLAYDGARVPSVLPLYPYAVVISSFSKNLSLPGERLGYVILSSRLEEKATLMAALMLTNRILGFVNPPVAGQYMMAAALGSQVDVAVYAARRDAMCRVLDAAGYTYLKPAGAFYFFPEAPGGDDVAFVNRLLQERILAVPGSGFGCPGYFRLAFCVDESVINRSLEGFKKARG